MAELDVQASFTLATNQSPGPLWLCLSVSAEDGHGTELRFPMPGYPEVVSPLKGVVLTSQGFGGVPIPIKVTDVVFQSIFDYPGIYILEIAADWEGTANLAQAIPLVIGIIVETATDRGQTLALASQSMRFDND